MLSSWSWDSLHFLKNLILELVHLLIFQEVLFSVSLQNIGLADQCLEAVYILQITLHTVWQVQRLNSQFEIALCILNQFFISVLNTKHLESNIFNYAVLLKLTIRVTLLSPEFILRKTLNFECLGLTASETHPDSRHCSSLLANSVHSL